MKAYNKNYPVKSRKAGILFKTKLFHRIKVAFLAAECAPIVKYGGLGDVIGSLPLALKKLDVDPIIFLPLNKNVNLRKWRAKEAGHFKIKYEGKSQKVEIYKAKLSSVAAYLLSNKTYFDKADIYSNIHGGGLKKFLFYSLASMEAMKTLKWKPDIIHCHDHQTGMAPNILQSHYKDSIFFSNVKTVFTIHNLDYQGRQNPKILDSIDRDIDKLASVVNDLKDGDVNFMAQGILTSDIVTTVSPTYAKEVLTKEFGAGLDNILKKRKSKLKGILNGIDVDFFNPTKDESIKQNYSRENLQNKTANKLWLQKKVGLPQSENVPLVGFISRLAWQKGLELITDELSLLDCQFVILGTGDKKYENKLKRLTKKYSDKFSAQIMFDIKLAQQIYAASDIFLMPSRYEPCGLGQMIAMRYGAVPVVRATGGLKDIVNKKVGFTFKKFNSDELRKALQGALRVYYKKPRQWRHLQINGMKKDFSWDKSAKEYVKLYTRLASRSKRGKLVK